MERRIKDKSVWTVIVMLINYDYKEHYQYVTASLGPAAGMLGASYAGCDKVAVVALICVATALMGTFYPGMKVNALDLSPNYAGTLMAIVNGIGAFTGIITPYLVGVLTPDVSDQFEFHISSD